MDSKIKIKTKLKGVTLLEILISIGIFALISAAMATIFNYSIFVYKAINDKNKVSQPASIAMEWLRRDISFATCIYEANSNSIVLYNPDTGATGGYINYYLPNPSTLVREACGVDHLLAEDLTNLNFTYYTSLNQPATSASNSEEVEINLKTSSGKQDFTLYAVVSPQTCIDCLFSKTYGGSSSDSLNCLQQTFNSSGDPDGYILGGYTDSFVVGGGGGRNFLAIRTDVLGNRGPAGTWAYAYGGTLLDELRFLQQSFSGANPDGYILGGYTASFGAGGDFLVIKTGTTGATVTWANSYGGTLIDELRCLQQINDYSYILGGYTTSFGGAGDFLVIKITNGGTTSWAYNYGTITGVDSLRFIQQSFSSGVPDGYILGGDTTSFSVQNGAFLVIKTDTTGAIATWTRTYDGSSADNLRVIQQTKDEGYILGGYTTSFGIGGDFLVIKTDNTGVVSWAKTYGGSNTDDLSFLQQTNDDGYILGGYTTSFGIGGNFLLIKTDSSGVVSWAKTYGGTDIDDLRFLGQTSNGGYILGGYTRSFGAGVEDFLVIRTDSLGNISCCVAGFSATSVTVTGTSRTITGTPQPTLPSPVDVTAGVLGVPQSVSPTSATVNPSTICPSP